MIHKEAIDLYFDSTSSTYVECDVSQIDSPTFLKLRGGGKGSSGHGLGITGAAVQSPSPRTLRSAARNIPPGSSTAGSSAAGELVSRDIGDLATTSSLRTSGLRASTPTTSLSSTTPRATRQGSDCSLFRGSQSGNDGPNPMLPTEGARQNIIARCLSATKKALTNCTPGSGKQDVNKPCYERIFDALPEQIMEKRTGQSATAKYINNDVPFQFTTTDKIRLLVETNTIHGIVCDGLVEQLKINNKPANSNHNSHDVKPSQNVFLVCSRVLPRFTCRAQLQLKIDAKNATLSPEQHFKINESQLEINGLQARFCLPDNDGTLEIIV